MIPPDELFGPEPELKPSLIPAEMFDLFGSGPLPEPPNGVINDVRYLSAYEHELKKVTQWNSSSSDPFPSPNEDVDNVEDADLITSKLAGDRRHTLMLDLDVPAVLVPSSTPGNSHLYIDVPMRWKHVVAILEALVDAGVVQEGYARASEARRYTALRLPWKPKGA